MPRVGRCGLHCRLRNPTTTPTQTAAATTTSRAAPSALPWPHTAGIPPPQPPNRREPPASGIRGWNRQGRETKSENTDENEWLCVVQQERQVWRMYVQNQRLLTGFTSNESCALERADITAEAKLINWVFVPLPFSDSMTCYHVILVNVSRKSFWTIVLCYSPCCWEGLYKHLPYSPQIKFNQSFCLHGLILKAALSCNFQP